MEAVTLADLGPIIAAVLGPMLAFIVVSMRYQHHDSVKTRELITSSEKETREWVTGQLAPLGADLKDLSRGLGDVRERLARIEGHLGVVGVPPQGEADVPDSGGG